MGHYFGCAPLARQLSLSAIEGLAFFLLLVVSWRVPAILGDIPTLGSTDHVFIALLSCSAFAAMCAMRADATNESYPVNATGVLRPALVHGLRVAVVVVIIAMPLAYAYSLIDSQRMGLVLATITSTSLVPLAIVLVRVLQRPFFALRYFRRRVVFVGEHSFGDRCRELSGRLAPSLDIAGFLDLGEGDFDHVDSDERVARNCGARLRQFLRGMRPDEVVIATRDGQGRGFAAARLLAELPNLKPRGVRVLDFSEFWERETGQVDLHTLQPSCLFFERGFSGTATIHVKRIFDILVSCLLLVVGCPLFPLIAVMLKVCSPGPIIFKQQRVGLGGPPLHYVQVPQHVRGRRAYVGTDLGIST